MYVCNVCMHVCMCVSCHVTAPEALRITLQDSSLFYGNALDTLSEEETLCLKLLP